MSVRILQGNGNRTRRSTHTCAHAHTCIARHTHTHTLIQIYSKELALCKCSICRTDGNSQAGAGNSQAGVDAAVLRQNSFSLKETSVLLLRSPN